MKVDVPIGVVVSTKDTFTDTFIDTVTPVIQTGLYKRIWRRILKEQEEKKIKNKRMEENPYVIFQQAMMNIPQWNDYQITEEYEEIASNFETPKTMEDILSLILIFNVRILNLANEYDVKKNNCEKKGKKEKDKDEIPNENKDIEVIIPKPKNFIHRVYINIGKKLKTQPYLMNTENEKGTRRRAREIQLDNETVIKIIEKSIRETINQYLPVSKISDRAVSRLLNKPPVEESKPLEIKLKPKQEQESPEINQKQEFPGINQKQEFPERKPNIKTVNLDTNIKRGILSNRTKPRKHEFLDMKEREMATISNPDHISRKHLFIEENEDEDEDEDDMNYDIDDNYYDEDEDEFYEIEDDEDEDEEEDEVEVEEEEED